MYRLRVPIIVLLALSLISYGCVTTPTRADGEMSPAACIAAHTAGGAIIGGIIGAIAGDRQGLKKGLLIGGGLALAYAWGKCFQHYTTSKSEQIKDYDTTAREVGYSPQSGLVARIENYSLTPVVAAPGDTVRFDAVYYVMSPNRDSDIPVTEIRKLKRFNDKENTYVELGEAVSSITAKPGLRKADGNIQIPENVEEGKYLISFLITAEGKTDVLERPLIISKDRRVPSRFQHVVTAYDTPKTDKASVSPSVAKGEKVVTQTKEKTVLINQSRVNLRASPSSQAKIISTASKGERYPLVSMAEIEGKIWYQIRLDDGTTVWLLGSLAQILED